MSLEDVIKNEILVASKLDGFIDKLTKECVKLYKAKQFEQLKTRLDPHKLRIRAEPINKLSRSDEETQGWEFLSFFEREGASIERGGALFAAAQRLGPEYVKALDIIALWRTLACLTTKWLDDENELKPAKYYHVNISKELVQDSSYRGKLEIVLSYLQESIITLRNGVPIFEMSEKLDNIYDDIPTIRKLSLFLNMEKKGSFFAWDDTFYIQDELIRVPVVYHLEFYDQTKFLKIDYRFFQLLYEKIDVFSSVFSNLLKIDCYFEDKENLFIFEGVEETHHKEMLRNRLIKENNYCLIQGECVGFEA